MTNITFPSGLYFTPKSKLVDSLFNPGRTAAGYYLKRPNGILFKRPNATPWFFLCANSPVNPFYVSCTADPKGRTVYMFAMSTIDKEYLGLTGYTQSMEHALNVWEA